MTRSSLLMLCLATLLAPLSAPGESLFPSFETEVVTSQTFPDGSRFEAAPVRETWGGDWKVSQVEGGGRVMVSFRDRELTGIDPETGTYWTIAFDRLGELRRRLLEADRRAERPALDKAALAAPVQVELLPAAKAAAEEGPSGPWRAARSQALRVRGGAEEATVWVDPELRLGPAALDALADLESALAGAGSAKSAGASAAVVASRYSEGALPVRVVTPLAAGASRQETVLAVEPIAALPRELLRVPDGFRRVPHPLEAIVAALEAEKALDRQMAGGGR